MTATVTHLPDIPADTTPALTVWAAAGLTLAGFLPPDATAIASALSRSPQEAAALTVAMERLAWADPVAVARLWEARPR